MLWTTPKQLLVIYHDTYKLNIELGERGFKNGNMIQHGVYHKNTRIFYRGKIVSSSYVQDCSIVIDNSDVSDLYSKSPTDTRNPTYHLTLSQTETYGFVLI
jgi:hypothetical protein